MRRFHNGVMFSLDRSTSLPMSMVQKPAPGGTVQHCRKPISPLKDKQKEKAISANEVNTMSKFPKAYSLTGEQIPAAKCQPRRSKGPTPLCMCTEVNRPCHKRTSDTYDRLKQSRREANVPNIPPPTPCVNNVPNSLFEIRRIRQQQAPQNTHVLNHYGVKVEPNSPLISRPSASSSDLRWIVSKTKRSNVRPKKVSNSRAGAAELRAVKCAAHWRLGGERARNAADFSEEFQSGAGGGGGRGGRGRGEGSDKAKGQ